MGLKRAVVKSYMAGDIPAETITIMNPYNMKAVTLTLLTLNNAEEIKHLQSFQGTDNIKFVSLTFAKAVTLSNTKIGGLCVCLNPSFPTPFPWILKWVPNGARIILSFHRCTNKTYHLKFA